MSVNLKGTWTKNIKKTKKKKHTHTYLGGDSVWSIVQSRFSACKFWTTFPWSTSQPLISSSSLEHLARSIRLCLAPSLLGWHALLHLSHKKDLLLVQATQITVAFAGHERSGHAWHCRIKKKKKTQPTVRTDTKGCYGNNHLSLSCEFFFWVVPKCPSGRIPRRAPLQHPIAIDSVATNPLDAEIIRPIVVEMYVFVLEAPNGYSPSLAACGEAKNAVWAVVLRETSPAEVPGGLIAYLR